MGLRSIKPLTLEEQVQHRLRFWRDFRSWLSQMQREIPEGVTIRAGSMQAINLQAVLQLIDEARPIIEAKLKQVEQPKENNE